MGMIGFKHAAASPFGGMGSAALVAMTTRNVDMLKQIKVSVHHVSEAFDRNDRMIRALLRNIDANHIQTTERF